MSDSPGPTAHNSVGGSRDHRFVDALGVRPTPFYQPIVSVPDGAMVGYEAFARWPNLNYPDPNLVFDFASRQSAALAELDERCISASLDTVLQSDFGSGALLFINTHPSCDFPGDAVDARAEQLTARRLRLVFELTEDHLLVHPRMLMKKVDAIRQRGWAIAFDNFGVNSAALPLLDVIRPGIVKLDVKLVRSAPRVHESQVMAAVLTYQERTNAVLLAEGIETAGHYKRALAWGATLGQGHRFGRPGPLAMMRSTPWRDFEFPIPPPVGAPLIDGSPFDTLIAAGAQPRRALMSTIQALARHVRVIATRPENPSMVFVVLPDDGLFRLVQTARRRLEKVAATVPFMAVYGPDLPPSVAASGVHTVRVAPSDPLSQDLLILALGPHAAAAVAVRRPERAELIDVDSRLTYLATYDRQHVTSIASHLLARMT
jgi:EAL domain-containing protein (putative c-di-GMP-specific phosphodiesterase class I)